MNDLQFLLNPKSIAILGASSDFTRINGRTVKYLDKGYAGTMRGRAPVDRAALTQLVSSVSVLGAAAGTRLSELDPNPVFASADGVIAVDWLLVRD